jgi:hypothetical protein
MRMSVIICAAAIVARVFADPAPGTSMLMTDGTTIYPTNSVATPSDVAALAGQAQEAADVSRVALESFGTCADMVRLYSTNYVVTSTVYVQSVGAVAYDASNQTVRIQGITVTDTNITVLATVTQMPLVPPALDWRQTLGESGAWSNIAAAVQSVEIPVGVTNAAAAYAFTMTRPTGGTAFFRVIDNSTGASGSGLYWVVFGGIYVDGHRGASGIITNVVGSVTNYYRSVGGIIVEFEPLGGL